MYAESFENVSVYRGSERRSRPNPLTRQTLRKFTTTTSEKSNHKVYAHIVKHNYVLGGMLFTICKAQLLMR